MLSFVLIHGTKPKLGPVRLASKRSWTDCDSAFVRALRLSFPDSTIERFSWTGDNSHRARLAAGDELAQFLRAAPEPSAKSHRRILIAHSHGGNVALYALKKLTSAQSDHIAGLIFLGTPFLRARARDSRSLVDLWLAATFGGMLFSLLLALTWAKQSTLVTLFLGLCVIVSLAGVIRLCRINRARWNELALRHANALDATCASRIPMFAVCAIRDEALLLLNSVSIGTSILFRLRRSTFDWFATLLENLKETFRSFWSGIGDAIAQKLQDNLVDFIVGLAKLALLLVFSPLYLAMALIVIAPIVVLLLPFVIVGLSGILLLPIIALCSTQVIALITLATRSAPWGFGEHWLLQWVVELTVSKWPAEEIDLTSTEDRLGIWALQHSVLTKHPRFLDEMCRWIPRCIETESSMVTDKRS